MGRLAGGAAGIGVGVLRHGLAAGVAEEIEADPARFEVRTAVEVGLAGRVPIDGAVRRAEPLGYVERAVCRHVEPVAGDGLVGAEREGVGAVADGDRTRCRRRAAGWAGTAEGERLAVTGRHRCGDGVLAGGQPGGEVVALLAGQQRPGGVDIEGGVVRGLTVGVKLQEVAAVVLVARPHRDADAAGLGIFRGRGRLGDGRLLDGGRLFGDGGLLGDDLAAIAAAVGDGGVGLLGRDRHVLGGNRRGAGQWDEQGGQQDDGQRHAEDPSGPPGGSGWGWMVATNAQLVLLVVTCLLERRDGFVIHI